MNNWEATATMIQAGPARFLTDLVVEKGTYEFKIASADFSTIDLGGPDLGLAPVQGAATVLVDGGENVRFHAITTGTYRFVLDTTDIYRPALTFYLVTEREAAMTAQAK